MAILPIRKLPDPILRQKAHRVRPTELNDSLRKLVDDMIETMHDAYGVGIAANQVGVPQQICVIQLPGEDTARVLVNPQLVAKEGEREVVEGCLSIPGYRGTITRSNKVRVRALDIDGKLIRIQAEDDLLTQALEHEIGHLNGDLYIDHLVSRDAIWPIEELPEDEESEHKSELESEETTDGSR